MDDSGSGDSQIKISVIGMLEKWNCGMMGQKEFKIKIYSWFVQTSIPLFQYSMIPGGTVQEEC